MIRKIVLNNGAKVKVSNVFFGNNLYNITSSDSIEYNDGTTD